MYIPSHAALGNHPKLRRLARTLAVSRPAAVGHLHYLWWWSQDYAPDGDLSYERYTAEDIADAAMWEGDAYAFVDALKTSGFVDDRDGRLFLHDWEEYGGKVVKLLAKDRERKRGKGNPENSDAVPQSSDAVPNPSAGIPLEIPRNSDVDKIREEEIKREERERAAKPQRTLKRATPIPQPFDISDEMYEFGATLGFNDEGTRRESLKFVNYFLGNGKVMKDWNATWENWLLRANENKAQGQWTGRTK